MGEYGLIINKGITSIHNELPGILEDAKNELTTLSREVFNELWLEFQIKEEKFKACEVRLNAMNKDNQICVRLGEILGIGAITASATYEAVGDGKNVVNGRNFSAWVGLVPGQNTKGAKPTLLGISKRGNASLRTLYIHGARAVLRSTENKDDSFSKWTQALKARRGHNKVCVAVANKIARMAWVIMAKGESYRPAT